MTQPPSWVLVPPPDIHQIPGGMVRPQPPLSWQQIKATAEFWLNSFIGQIAIAFGGIDIAGWRPFDFLADWGQQRIADAAANYQAALSAQKSANWANVQLTILTGNGAASDVPGGVAVSDGFTGAAASNPGPQFQRFKRDGPGGGNFGLNGSGRCVWHKSGGLWQRELYAEVKPLTTDYMMVMTIIGQPAQDTQFLGEDAEAYLLARIKSDGSEAVWLAIRHAALAIGWLSGSNFSTWESTKVSISGGDQFALLTGTEDDPCHFIVKQNGQIRLNDVYPSAYGPDRRLAGLGGKATTRSSFLDQTAPPELEVWAAADRLPTSL